MEHVARTRMLIVNAAVMVAIWEALSEISAPCVSCTGDVADVSRCQVLRCVLRWRRQRTFKVYTCYLLFVICCDDSQCAF